MEPLPALVVLDLDGTLFSSTGEVSPRNLAALRSCREANIDLCIATARGPATIAMTVPPILHEALWITHNGAEAVKGGRRVHFRPLPPEAFRAAVDFAHRHAAQPFLFAEIDGTPYASVDVSGFWGPGFQIVDFRQLGGAEVAKLLLRLPDVSDLSSLPLPPETEMVADRSGHTLLQRVGVSKHEALAACFEHFGIAWNRVCAFGDDVTDAGTLARAHWGVAMENAVPEAKAAAHFHTSTNDQDGVAEFLERLLR
jgi:hydroxymethylpyrimidine pyrophosphatase-like HAD family hydrolase